MHAHDDLGLATANTLAAALAGATHLNTTVNGLGERAGNAALEEVVLGLRQLYRIETGVDLKKFPALSALVENASGEPLGWRKSLVGKRVFSHEAGIHVDGLLKDPANYQGVDPAAVGRRHTLVLGKHSGRQGVIQAYAQLGIAWKSARPTACWRKCANSRCASAARPTTGSWRTCTAPCRNTRPAQPKPRRCSANGHRRLLHTGLPSLPDPIPAAFTTQTQQGVHHEPT